jgi:hypothetical protein
MIYSISISDKSSLIPSSSSSSTSDVVAFVVRLFYVFLFEASASTVTDGASVVNNQPIGILAV